MPVSGKTIDSNPSTIPVAFGDEPQLQTDWGLTLSLTNNSRRNTFRGVLHLLVECIPAGYVPQVA
jgi:hypothetical protein